LCAGPYQLKLVMAMRAMLTVVGCELDDRVFESRQGLEFFSLPLRPDRLWGPPAS